MSDLQGVRAAELIRGAVDLSLTKREFETAWPKAASSELDILNSRLSVISLFEARRSGDTELVEVLEADLDDIAAALEVGEPLEWFEAEPRWSKRANGIAFGIGAVGYIGGSELGWSWITRLMPLAVALATVWFAEWRWSRQLPDRKSAS